MDHAKSYCLTVYILSLLPYNDTMIEQFEEGETYRNEKYDQDIMVLGQEDGEENDVWLAILWVDRDTYESTSPDELQVFKKDFKDWTIVEF